MRLQIMKLIYVYKQVFSLNTYITYVMDFWFVPNDPICFEKLSRCD